MLGCLDHRKIRTMNKRMIILRQSLSTERTDCAVLVLILIFQLIPIIALLTFIS